MDGWVKRTGYPVVSVEAHPTHIELTQERLFITGKKDESNYLHCF